ncbi:hypothetical protein BKE38_22425 [Pseudoroseomonas deserti]|uniref:Uncharacterized protein n=1 Tax=Teichococcus deserti TaxID=1817963 RepID=A0A1V2GXB3_9PROT|nr:hypothetical protein [Pseudoroseomonas deserti]ONG47977.1 hypothetical protein BKE38_22425 [Pseudoroseomonas deserti]
MTRPFRAPGEPLPTKPAETIKVVVTRREAARAYLRAGHLPPLSLLSLAWFSWTLASAAAGLLIGLLLEGTAL